MKLSQLLSFYPEFKFGEEPTREITAISFDSRNVEEGSLYVAIKGLKADGHDFIQKAIDSGASGLVVESDENIPKDYSGAIVKVEDSRKELFRLASRFYGNPAEEMFCIGVTGTNGKTSVTYMLEAIFNHFGWTMGVMGTINHHIKDKVWESQLTTPDAVTLQKRLREFQALGARSVAFEVSSHAIMQKRVEYIPFDATVFTNLTRDHLDYHSSMDEYFEAKQRLFNEILWQSNKKTRYAIVNIDDPYGEKMKVTESARRWTYGEERGDFSFKILEQDFSGTLFQLKTPRGDIEIYLRLPGKHNVYNAVACVAVALSAGVSLESSVEALNNLSCIPGRLESVPNEMGIHVFIDYAHTDDALRTVLNSLNKVRKESEKPGRIITVYGCGGDRDKGKRPLMTQTVIEGSDYAYLTSDNPRYEDPKAIIQDALSQTPKALVGHRLFVEVDRREAIRKALEFAQKNDVVLIAGKGHEDYQLVGDKKLPFSDYKVVQEILG